MRRLTPIISLLLLVAPVEPAAGQFDLETPIATGNDHVSVRVIPSHLIVRPGQKLHMAVDIRIDDDWVFYAPTPGPYAIGGQLSVTAPYLIVGRTAWPKYKPKTTDLGTEKVVNNVYVKRAVVYVSLTVPDQSDPATDVTITTTLNGQICKTKCLDVNVTQTVTLQIAAQPVSNPDWLADATLARNLGQLPPETQPAPPPATSTEIDGQSVWLWLSIALLAGLSLNIMPCVLPIIPLRIHSVVAMAGESRRRFVLLGLVFAMGIWLFFAGFAGANLVVHAAMGRALEWSEQWKLPGVRLGMVLLVVAVAANLFGAFTVTVPQKVAALETRQPKTGYLATLGMGLMLAILATPCSAGVLLGVLGWAQTQPLWMATLAICLMGVGMAAPHALLCAMPKLVEKLPRPGRWMELFKQSMGFVLVPIALWLLTTLGPELSSILRTGTIATAFACGLWVWGTWIRYDTPPIRKWTYRAIVIVLIVAIGWLLLPEWKTDTTDLGALVESARAKGDVVVVKVTAEWCIECKVIDATVYRTDDVRAALAKPGVTFIKADVTNRGPATDWLRQFSASSPPHTLVFAPTGKPVSLPGDEIDIQRLLAAINTSHQP